MIRELYVRSARESGFQNNYIEFNDRFEFIKQKIMMILNTRKGELIGDPNFGCSLEDFLFELNPSSSAIQAEIQNQISFYIGEDSRDVAIETNVMLNRTESGEHVAVIDIIINGKNALTTTVKK